MTSNRDCPDLIRTVGQSANTYIHVLRRLFQCALDEILPLIMSFLIFTKVFDRTDRNVLFKFSVIWYTRTYYKCHQGAIHQFQEHGSCWWATVGRVRSQTGILQGDTPAPFLCYGWLHHDQKNRRLWLYHATLTVKSIFWDLFKLRGVRGRHCTHTCRE